MSGRKKKPYMSESAKDVVSGLVGGATGTLTVFPLDTLTTRAQAKYLQGTERYAGREAAERVWKGMPLIKRRKPASLVKRFSALYRGVPFKLMKAVPGTAITLGAYGITQRFLDKKFTSKKSK